MYEVLVFAVNKNNLSGTKCEQVQIGRSHTKSNLFDVPFILVLSCLTDSCSNCAPPLQSVKSFYSCNYEAELMFMPDGVYGNSAVECRLS